MRDQYDRPIPDDLVLLPTLDDGGPFTSADQGDLVQKVLGADWYEADGVLMASAEEIDYLSEADPADAGVDLAGRETIYCVADSLKRWNPSDSFYHA